MKRFVFVLLFCLFASPCFSATYYVDNSGCGDCADYRVVERDCGSGAEQNYDTINEAIAAASTAGDIVYVRAGTFTEKPAWTTDSGSDPDYITFEACHDGSDGDCSDADAYETVLVSNVAASSSAWMGNVSWIKIKGIHFQRTADTDQAFEIYGDTSHIYFEDCEFENGQYGTFHINPWSGNETVEYIYLDTCKFHGASGEGFYATCNANAGGTIQHVYLIDCEIYSNNEAIQISQRAGCQPNDFTIRGCEIYNNGAEGWALFDVDCDNLVIEDCLIHDNNNHSVSGIAAQNCSTVTIRNNVIYDNDGTASTDAAVYLDTVTTAYVYHNTIERQGSSGVGCGVWFAGDPTGNVVRNNIIANVADDSIHSDAGDCQYNVFYGIGDANGCDDGNNQTGDPKFVSVTNGSEDYHIQSGSSAIDNGTDVGITDDIEGTIRPLGSGYEIGAYEYEPAGAVTGTIVPGGCTESEIVSGGKTIVVTISSTTFVATFGQDNAITTAFIQGFDSAQSEAAGWNAEVRDKMTHSAITRTSDTVATVVLPATAGYQITSAETITLTIPATSTEWGTAITATPTFIISAEYIGSESVSAVYDATGPNIDYDATGSTIVTP